MRSNTIKQGLKRTPSRALLYGTGLTKTNLKKPFIGLCSSFTDLIPGHIGMRDLERSIEHGICAGGGNPFLFSVPGICDGIAMGHPGMRYSLPSRDLIADMIESVTEAHCLDGLVLLTNCDKITPGMLMAAGRLDLPTIVVTAGPMHSGQYQGKKLSLVRDTFEAIGLYQNKKISSKELEELEIAACPGQGSCQGLYTANTMACLTEAMGLSLPGCATALAGFAKKKRIAQESGEKICELVEKNLTARKIMTENAFKNAITVDMALGGSSNSVLHLTAIAKECGLDLPLSTFEKISRQTPNLTSLRPSGEYMMEDLEYAGGIPALLNVLKSKLANNLTVAGQSIRKIANDTEVINPEVIRPLNKAYHPEGGLAVLTGNLAPEGAIVKQSAVSPPMMKFEGQAKCFDSEKEAMEKILNKKIKKGDVIVIRYEGPVGGPGMPEMLYPTSAVVGLGLAEDVALITDGRFSGGTKGPCIGHIAPEAALKGPLAAVQDGDKIGIDIQSRKIELKISAADLQKRLANLKPFQPKIKTGWLARYIKMNM